MSFSLAQDWAGTTPRPEWGSNLAASLHRADSDVVHALEGSGEFTIERITTSWRSARLVLFPRRAVALWSHPM